MTDNNTINLNNKPLQAQAENSGYGFSNALIAGGLASAIGSYYINKSYGNKSYTDYSGLYKGAESPFGAGALTALKDVNVKAPRWVKGVGKLGVAGIVVGLLIKAFSFATSEK